MPDDNCNKYISLNFGKGFEHVKQIVYGNTVALNQGYTYGNEMELVKKYILEILSDG